MSNVLSQHPQLVCTHEPTPRLIDETAAFRYGELPLEDLAELFRASRPASLDGRRYGESANRHSLAIPALAAAFPDAHFISVVRDGRDFVSSGVQRGWYTDAAADTPWERNRLRGDRLGEVEADEWSSWSQVRKISWLWQRTHRLIDEDTTALGADRTIHVRLEDLGSELSRIAQFLEVPDIRWVVPTLNARAAVPDTGVGTANEVQSSLEYADWSADDRADFAIEAGDRMNRTYPGWQDTEPGFGTAQEGASPIDPTIADVRVELAELRTLRGELGVLTQHQIRADRLMIDLRAKNEQLVGQLNASVEKRAAKQEVNVELAAKLKVARSQTESWKTRASESKKHVAQLERELRELRSRVDAIAPLEFEVAAAQDKARRVTIALDRAKKSNKTLQREAKASKAQLEALLASESYKTGHRLVRAAKLPAKAARRLTQSSATSATPAANAKKPAPVSASKPKSTGSWSAPDPELGHADLDRLDPSTIAAGALHSFSMTAPTGPEDVDRLRSALRTLKPGAKGRLVLPTGLTEDRAARIIDAVTAAGTARAATSPDSGEASLEVWPSTSSESTERHLTASLLVLAGQLGQRVPSTNRQIADLERKLKLEKDARRRQAEEAQDSTQYRLGASLLSVVHQPKNIIHLPGEIRSLQQRRTAPASPPKSSEFEPSLDLKVASVLDEFTHDCFAPEMDLIALDRRAFRDQVDSADLVFVESAWRGNGGTWNYTVNRFDDRGQDLQTVLNRAAERKIPTVFWNKEDPVSFDVFIGAAQHFDHIFTTDSDVVDAYRKAVGHDRVQALPFAAQPRLHNPIGRGRGDQVASRLCFAGSWRGDKYTQRGNDFDALLTPALERGALDIYDRYAGTPEEERHGFPEPFKSAVLGSLPYSEIGSAYRAYAGFLNVNSVQDSPTMFSRRVFELLACGTPVISTPARGIDELLGETVLITDSKAQTNEHVDWVLNEPEQRDRHAHLGYRLVHSQHAYEHRVDTMLEQAGVAPKRRRRRVTVICVSNRPAMVDHAIASFLKQNYVDKEFVYVANSNEVDATFLSSVEQRVPGARALHIDESATLGECLNEALRITNGDYFAKFDDDDHYGENYLSDLMLTFPYSGAAVAGKQTYYAYMSRTDETVLRFPGKEFKHAPRVVGGTIVADRELVDGIEFEAVPRGTDTRFLEAVKARGLKVFSADRFNFCQVRQVDPNQHTWAIDEEEFLKACTRVGNGFLEDEVFL